MPSQVDNLVLKVMQNGAVVSHSFLLYWFNSNMVLKKSTSTKKASVSVVVSVPAFPM